MDYIYYIYLYTLCLTDLMIILIYSNSLVYAKNQTLASSKLLIND